MSVYRLDRQGPEYDTEWFTCQQAADDRAKWLTAHGTKLLVVWLDHATYVPIETCPPAPSLASRIKTRITQADEGIAS